MVSRLEFEKKVFMKRFQSVSVITTIIKCILEMDLSHILSVTHAITIGTLLNFCGGSNKHWLKKALRVNRPQW